MGNLVRASAFVVAGLLAGCADQQAQQYPQSNSYGCPTLDCSFVSQTNRQPAYYYRQPAPAYYQPTPTYYQPIPEPSPPAYVARAPEPSPAPVVPAAPSGGSGFSLFPRAEAAEPQTRSGPISPGFPAICAGR